jgi:hypothetical protein
MRAGRNIMYLANYKCYQRFLQYMYEREAQKKMDKLGKTAPKKQAGKPSETPQLGLFDVRPDSG